MGLISRQAAYETLSEYYHHKTEVQHQGLREALDRVPSTEPENADCIYCHEDSDGYVKPIEKNNHAFVRFGMNGWELDLKANGWHGSAKIRYCPMCGRLLLRGGEEKG